MAALVQPTMQLMQTAVVVVAPVQLAVRLDQVMLVLVALEALHLLLEHHYFMQEVVAGVIILLLAE
jgi:hypothetical protein